MLAVPVHKDTVVTAHVMRTSAAKKRVKEGMWDAPQCLHGCLKAVSTDVEHDTSLPRPRLLVHVHGLNIAPKPGAPHGCLRRALVRSLTTSTSPWVRSLVTSACAPSICSRAVATNLVTLVRNVDLSPAALSERRTHPHAQRCCPKLRGHKDYLRLLPDFII
jgi:hypothetical protein